MPALPTTTAAPSVPAAVTEPVLRARGVSKAYRLWRSPRDRLWFALWGGLPGWLPHPWRARAERRQEKLVREFFALRDVSLTLERGESLGIIGRNGSGKSTLLQIIAGVLQPSAGEMTVRATRVAALLELGSGFNPEFSGRENIEINSAILGFTREQLRGRIDEIIQFADIGDFIDRPVKQYSSGMTLRVAFAVSVFLEPEILIVDEALAVGDAPFQAKCFRKIRELQAKGTTLLFTSHEMGTVRSLCSRALWLKEGAVQALGPSEEVARAYEIFCWEAQGIQVRADAGAGAGVAPTPSKRSAPPAVTPQAPAFLRVNRDAFQKSAVVHRFGTRELEVLNVALTDSQGLPATTFRYAEEGGIHLLLRANGAIAGDTVIGLQVKTVRGDVVLSADPVHEVKPLPVEDGTTLHARTDLPMILSAGKYVLTVGVYGFRDGTAYEHGRFSFSRAVVLDFIEVAATFEVLPERGGLAGPVHLHRTFQFETVQDVEEA